MVFATIFADALPDELVQLVEQFGGFVRGYKSMARALEGKPHCSIQHYNWLENCWYYTGWSTPGADAISMCHSNQNWWLLPDPLENTLPITWYEFCRRRGQGGRLMLRETDESRGWVGRWVPQ